MKNLLLMGSFALSSLFVSADGHAKTELIFNSDTGVTQSIASNPKIVRQAENNVGTTQPVLQSELAADTDAKIDPQDYDETAADRAQGENDLNARVDYNEKSTDAEDVSEERIQSIQREDVGVEATATTKIDMR